MGSENRADEMKEGGPAGMVMIRAGQHVAGEGLEGAKCLWLKVELWSWWMGTALCFLRSLHTIRVQERGLQWIKQTCKH